ncbi:monocarboxylate transporter 12-like [Onthophagus taurus]|uniref:monocarboxylate transporter 12-like n=1 Tax=Onthophagus taurus TaxID=166361 RepID=UPI000C20C2D6|nr:uncharacterized protein LOC111426106 [Onthophagus taurus]XP_022916239.1 uncharacterized protein LOC111426106 [Onthophagus taurus]
MAEKKLDTIASTARTAGSGTDSLPVNASVSAAVESTTTSHNNNNHINHIITNGSPYKQPLKLQFTNLYPNDKEVDALLPSSLKVSTVSPDGEKSSLHVQFDHVDDEDESIKEQPSPSSIDSDSSSSSSSSSSEKSIEISEARPPDGGWGWVVVAASFVVNLIADGITFSFGVIFVEFLEYFGENRAKTSWIGSLFMAMPLLSGPIASFLTDRYGCRAVTMAGSVLAAAGFVISSMSNSMEVLIITFGVFAGFGLSLCYVASVVIVAYYFDKKRSFATGLSVCGSGIGTFIFAPLIQLLLDHYGWRGTTLILAGLFLNLAVCGALMRDLPWTPSSLKSKERKKNKILKKKKSQSSADTFSVSNSTNTASVLQPILEANENPHHEDEDELHGHDRLSSSLVNLPTYVKNGEKVPVEVLELLSKNPNVYNVLMHNYPNLLTQSRSFSDSGRLNEAHLLQQKHSVPSPLSVNPPPIQNQSSDAALLWWLKRSDISPPRMIHAKKTVQPAYLKDLRVHRLSLTYRGAMLNINRYRLRASSCPDIYRNSMTTIAKEKHDFFGGFRDLKKILVDMFDFSHFADPKFLIFAISNFLLYTWYDVPYVYLSDYANTIELPKEVGSFLISNIGIINMIGEIMLGWAGDRPEFDAGIIYAVCMGFCGAATAFIPILRSYSALLVATGAFGLFIAANYSLTCIILVDLLSLDKFTNAYGLLLLVQGIANLIGPPIAGWIFDITGKYDLSFYLSGFFIGLSGLLLFILPATKRYRRFQTLHRQASECTMNGELDPKEPRFYNILTSCITGQVNEKRKKNITEEQHV